MKRTLYLKLLLGYVAFGILAFLTIATFTSRQTLNYVEKDAISSMYRESNLLASSYASNFYRGSMTLEDITSQFHSVATYLDAEIWLIGGKGNILITTNSDSVPDGLVKNFNISSFGTKYYQKGTFFDTFSEKTITVFSPVTINYKVRGYLMIHKPVSDLVRFKDGFLNISYLTLAIIFLCAFVMLGLFTFTVYIPIRKITQAAKEYSEGNFDTKINIHSNDEIGYLAGSINYMAAELSTLEEDQRKFIANVSHDFRSLLLQLKATSKQLWTVPFRMKCRTNT